MTVRRKSQSRERARLAAEPPVCVPKFRTDLPPSEWEPAARTAVDHNPANDVPEVRARGLLASGMPRPQFIAVAVGNYWGAKGVHLGVRFLDNPTAACRSKILAAANVWGQAANVRFGESLQGEIRLARQSGQGYYSYLGPDILHVPADEQTMNLEAFTESTPDSEYMRVVPHEFGHTMGAIHDQLRKDIQDLLDPEKTVAYFMRTQGWSRQDVIAQILTPVSEGDLMTLGPADQRSIMTYQFPGSVTKSGKPILGGLKVNQGDFALMARLYPKDTPVPPSPPAPPTSGTRRLTLDVDSVSLRAAVVSFA